MNGGISQAERVRQGVVRENRERGYFADRLPPRKPTLSELIERFDRVDSHWTPESDGLSHDYADDIRVYLIEELGLTKAECEALGRVL